MQLIIVKETTTCEYEAVLITQQLCKNRAYQYVFYLILKCVTITYYFTVALKVNQFIIFYVNHLIILQGMLYFLIHFTC